MTDRLARTHPRVPRLYAQQTGDALPEGSGTLALVSGETLHAYLVYTMQRDGRAHLDWIYGPGHGKDLMARFERHLRRRGVPGITLNLSLDPTEHKKTVLRRFNFYAGLGYRAADIRFREAHGPLLMLEKSL